MIYILTINRSSKQVLVQVRAHSGSSRHSPQQPALSLSDVQVRVNWDPHSSVQYTGYHILHCMRYRLSSTRRGGLRTRPRRRLSQKDLFNLFIAVHQIYYKYSRLARAQQQYSMCYISDFASLRSVFCLRCSLVHCSRNLSSDGGTVECTPSEDFSRHWTGATSA